MVKVLRRITSIKGVATSNSSLTSANELPLERPPARPSPVTNNATGKQMGISPVNPGSSPSALRGSSRKEQSTQLYSQHVSALTGPIPVESVEQHPNENVGYGKPPAQFQFKKGQSGNPKGRSKGSKNLRTLFEAEWEAPVEVLEGGRKRKISKGALITKNLFRQAAKGDLKAAAATFKMEERFSKPPTEGMSPSHSMATDSSTQVLSPMQRLIIECFGPKTIPDAVPSMPIDNESAASKKKTSLIKSGEQKS